jgi:hypothetical protein
VIEVYQTNQLVSRYIERSSVDILRSEEIVVDVD